MVGPREVIHLSLGCEACSVTTHWLNLQGLSTTESSYCEPLVTQAVRDGYYIPRAIQVDGPDAFSAPDVPSLQDPLPTWGGSMEVWNDNPRAARDPAISEFFDGAASLAFSPYSRYKAPTLAPSQSLSSNDGRHVDWQTELEEEEEEVSEEDVEAARRMKERQEKQWFGNSFPLMQESLEAFWRTQPRNLSWVDYWMPPISESLTMPMATSSVVANDGWNSYVKGATVDAWTEDTLLERLRVILEDCDSCQGVVLACPPTGVFAGIGTLILQHLHEECPSVGKWLIRVAKEAEQSRSQDPPSWHSHMVSRVRHQIEDALAMRDAFETADCILPVVVPSASSLFESSAHVALALEAATLNYRLRETAKSRIAINSASYTGSWGGESMFGKAPTLTFREFINTLRPDRIHCVLELDTMLPDTFQDDIWPDLLKGTRLEGDHRMKQGHQTSGVRRPRDSLPGKWMLSSREGGLLSCFSGTEQSRTSHSHFCLSASLRSVSKVYKELPNPNPLSYAECLVEGQGIRYRPESVLATVLDQSISTLTFQGYGAGSYWRTIFQNNNLPVLSVLGNTTRCHSALCATTLRMKEALSPKFRGFYNRDVLSGIVPEEEDCQEALSACLEVLDAYKPPGDTEDEIDIDY